MRERTPFIAVVTALICILVSFAATPAFARTVSPYPSTPPTAQALDAPSKQSRIPSTPPTAALRPVTDRASAAVPAITKVAPSAGPLSGGQKVVISGTGLAGVTRVKFGKLPGTSVVKVSASSLTVITPARGTAGTVSVVAVSASGNSAVSAASKYTYVARPTVSSVSPNSTTRTVETVLTLTGSGFSGVTSVLFGTTAAKAFTIVSDTQMRAITPMVGWKGTVNATVSSAGGSSVGSSAAAVTFKDPSSVRGTFTLSPNESLTSANGQYQLLMQGDGNLVLYRIGGAVIWVTPTSGPNRYAVLQSDGNFVVYTGTTALWNSGTAGWSDANLVVQDDGNLVIYGGGRAIWSKAGVLYDRLEPGNTLSSNQVLKSPNRVYTLIMQSDGNLVLYKEGAGAQWATTTNGPGRWLVMQTDGNLVVYVGSTALWSSGTAGNPGSYLKVQDDGNLVIYQGFRPVWSRYGTGLGAKLDALVNKYRGTYVDYDGLYGAQCVDLFNFYNRDVIGSGFMSVSYAYQLYTSFPSPGPSFYTKVAAGSTAQKGDVAVWSGSLPGSGGAGHVAMVLSDGGSTLTVFQQNNPVGAPSQVGTFSKNYLLGYLRPINQS